MTPASPVIAFDWLAFAFTELAVLGSAAISAAEGTFTNRKVTMGFRNHAGMWSDLIIMAPVVGFVLPYTTKSIGPVSAVVVASLIVTIAAHRQWLTWFRAAKITCHMYPAHRHDSLWRSLSIAGWAHVIVMIALLSIVFLFTFARMPRSTTLIVTTLLTVHVWVSTTLPGWYCTGVLLSSRNLTPPCALTMVLWILAAFKIYRP